MPSYHEWVTNLEFAAMLPQVQARLAHSTHRSPMSELSKPIFTSELLRVGMFRCPIGHPHFEDTGPIKSGHLIVFPRTSVCITHAGGEPIITDPNLVMFYNQHQIYRRRKVAERGDSCDWFAFAPEIIASTLQAYDPGAAERHEQPFHFTHAPSDAHSYLGQRVVVEHILGADQPDPLFVEETMLGVLHRVICHAYQVYEGSCATRTRHNQLHHAALARAAQEILTAHFRDEITLTDLAQEISSSPFQLCRIFRQYTGYTIHQYLNQIRLRTALEEIAQGALDLTMLAFDLGYASHSHFTQAFRQTFGVPPSRLRARFCTETRKNLIV
jgi:AraC-like DNA-binding protein